MGTYKCEIENIEKVGTSGMFKAYLSLTNHSEFAEIIGENLNECVTRAVIARDAFNDFKKVSA